MDQESDLRFSKLNAWTLYQAKVAEAKQVLDTEREMRQELVKLFFPSPKEGTNYLPLDEGWRLKLIYPMNRKVDPAAILPVIAELRAMGAPADALIDWEPKVNAAILKTLDDNAKMVLSQAVTTKPGSVSLELCAPKSKT